MNLFELFIKIGVDDQATNKIEGFRQKLGSGLETAARIGTAAVATAAAGITALTTSAVKNYAEYEQLVGGVEVLFKQSADTVQKYAQNAYKTAGLSANQYMDTVTSFSASLLSSLGGDTAKAADYADQAITDMSDNANRMGTDISMIQNAYQGFAKQNYTMLDNLKLGYGGTKTEMERLIADANRVKEANGEMADLSIDSFADVTEAIHIVQEEMGIAGATAEEASTTITGSVSAMRSAWSNLVTGLADDEADMEVLIDNFVQSVIDVGDNLIPRIETAVGGVGELLEAFATDILPMIVDILIQNLPAIIDTGFKILGSLAVGMVKALPQLVKVAPQIVSTLYDSLKSAIKSAWTWGKDLVLNFIGGIVDSIPSLEDVVSGMAQKVKDFIGFSEPKEGPLSNFHTYAPDMMDLFIKGIKDNEDKLQGQIAKTFNFGEKTISGMYDVTASGGGFGGVSVVQNIYSQAKSAADLMQEALYQQERAVYLGV